MRRALLFLCALLGVAVLASQPMGQEPSTPSLEPPQSQEQWEVEPESGWHAADGAGPLARGDDDSCLPGERGSRGAHDTRTPLSDEDEAGPESQGADGPSGEDAWLEPEGDPQGPDGIWGPPGPSLQGRLPPGDARAGVLSRDVPQQGSGDFQVLEGLEPAPDEDAEEVFDVRVEIEEGVRVDEETFGRFVLSTLNDERGWPAQISVSFSRTDADADMRVLLATPDTVDELCAPLRTLGMYSCATSNAAVLNAERWAQGAPAFSYGGGTVTEYRQYLVNHEVGHLLGYGHRHCSGPGEPAHVMVQQSISLEGCAPNAWLVTD